MSCNPLQLSCAVVKSVCVVRTLLEIPMQQQFIACSCVVCLLHAITMYILENKEYCENKLDGSLSYFMEWIHKGLKNDLWCHLYADLLIYS